LGTACLRGFEKRRGLVALDAPIPEIVSSRLYPGLLSTQPFSLVSIDDGMICPAVSLARSKLADKRARVHDADAVTDSEALRPFPTRVTMARAFTDRHSIVDMQ